MEQTPHDRARAKAALRHRTIVLVGLMGAGKTSVGRRLASELGMAFVDGDDEIEEAAGLTIPEIFELYGEQRFREGERRVMQRLLKAPAHVLATGGGAFMDPETREAIRERAVSVWLKADIEVLAKRVSRKDSRPLLSGQDPREVLSHLAALREPVYAEADLTIELGERPHGATVAAIIDGLNALSEGKAA